MADHDAAATGHNPDASVPKPGDAAWTLDFGEYEWFSAPSLDLERAYVGVKRWAETPANTEVRAHNLADGSVEWSHGLPHSGTFQPALGTGPDGDPALFVVSGQDDSNTGPGKGSVRALDPKTGDRHWEWSVDRVLGCPPVVADGFVYVATTPYGKPGVYALDVRSGEKEWFFPGGEVLHNAPTVADGTAYVSSGREELAALDATSGEVEWRVPSRADDCRPVVNSTAGLVYVGNRRGLEAFDAADGDRKWTFTATDTSTPEEDWLGVTTEPVVAGDTLYVRTSDTSGFSVGDPGNLHALDAASGERLWTLESGRPDSHVVGANGRALVTRASAADAGTASGSDEPNRSLVSLDSDGGTVWTAGTWAPLSVGSGHLFCYRGDRASAPGTATLAAFRTEA